MAIRVICKECSSKIDAKDELLGQIRKCPKCQKPILIQPENAQLSKGNQTAHIDKKTPDAALKKDQTATVASKDQTPKKASEEISYNNIDGIPHLKTPTSLAPNNKYFIFAYDRMLAYWEVGKGWQYNVGSGFASAKRNKDEIPIEGLYVFVEMIISQTDSGRQLSGLRIYSITEKWALHAISREEHEILSKLSGKGMLSKQQRLQLLSFIRKTYMPDFLYHAKNVCDYLLADYNTAHEVFVEDFEPDGHSK